MDYICFRLYIWRKSRLRTLNLTNLAIKKSFFLWRRKLATCIENILINTCLHGSEDAYFQVNFGQQFSHCIGWTNVIFISLLQPPKLAWKGLTPNDHGFISIWTFHLMKKAWLQNFEHGSCKAWCCFGRTVCHWHRLNCPLCWMISCNFSESNFDFGG